MPDVGMADFQISRKRMVILACEKWWPLRHVLYAAHEIKV